MVDVGDVADAAGRSRTLRRDDVSVDIEHDGYVAVESVQFADANIGISDTNLMVLTSGTLTVDGKVASTTLETSGAATVGGDDAVEHCGSGDHAQRVDVSVDITWRWSRCVCRRHIGIGTRPDGIDVGDDGWRVRRTGLWAGDLTLSNTAAVAITHSGSTSLSISSNGYVAVESVQFAVDDRHGDELRAATVGGDLTLSNTAAVAITHSGSTSLSISSGGYVAVESVQFADANIGISGDTDLMVLTSGTLTVDGKVASTTLETSGAATVGTTLDVDEPDEHVGCYRGDDAGQHGRAAC